MMRTRFLILLLLFGFLGCRQGNIDTKTAIQNWKQELRTSKQLGPPCTYKNLASTEAQKWIKDNPDQMDGLPADEDIHSVWADLNNDGKNDLLLYFQGVNCSGHNGGTQAYAKIIYSNGTRNSLLMPEIRDAILAEYNRMRETNSNLKAVTADFLETTTTITGYQNGITGSFRLYTKEDPHCCPSYSGTYTYRLPVKKMTLNISKSS